jgi:predicted nucleic acid-binding protein
VGALTIPASGLVYFDANCFIYSVEKVEPYHSLLRPLWEGARASQIQIVTSELSWMETLVKPFKDANLPLEWLFRPLLFANDVRLIPATLSVWEDAAHLRGLGLKTPDALHAATADRRARRFS